MTSVGTVLSNPIPPYSNVPIQANYFEPSQFFISTVSLGVLTTVTTTENHNYVVSQLVRLLIPPQFGCIQLNQLTGYVLSIPAANQVTVNIDSSKNVNPFQTSTAATQPQIVAVGDISSGATNAAGNLNTSITIPGAFNNISPV